MELTVDRQQFDHPQRARVTKRLRDHRGNPIGTANDNPILNTRMYEVVFDDSHKLSMAANLIAENMLAQLDEEGYSLAVVKAIVNHKMDPYITIDKAYVLW